MESQVSNYRVTLESTYYQVFEVEAATPEEAAFIAEQFHEEITEVDSYDGRARLFDVVEVV